MNFLSSAENRTAVIIERRKIFQTSVTLETPNARNVRRNAVFFRVTLLLVDFFRVEHAFADDDVIVLSGVQFAEEATRIALVTSGTADLIDFQ